MNIFKNIYLHFKYNRILKRVYKDENILDNMGDLFNSKIHVDWVGRIYTVINPNLDKDKQIYEILDDGIDNREFIQHWVMERFIAMDHFIKANNLFDLLVYDIKQLDDYGNFLLVLEPITLKDCMSAIKKIGIFLIILITAFILLKTFNIL